MADLVPCGPAAWKLKSQAWTVRHNAPSYELKMIVHTSNVTVPRCALKAPGENSMMAVSSSAMTLDPRTYGFCQSIVLGYRGGAFMVAILGVLAQQIF